MKFKKIIALVALAFIGVFTFVSCNSNQSGITESNVQITTSSVTSKTVTLSVRFDKNDNLTTGAASTYFKQYEVEDGNETYKLMEKLDVDTSTYSATKTFSGLTASTKYRFKLFVTFNGNDTEITHHDVTTNSNSQTEDNAIHITTVDDFEKMVNDPTSYYVLDNDLDFAGETLSTRFNATTKFSGTFDGKGHTIKNYAVPNSEYTGLFEYALSATIKNLNVSDVTANFSSSSKGNTKCGAIVGYAERTLITDCTVDNIDFKYSALSSAESYFGGVIGLGVNDTIENTKVTNAKITSTQARLKLSIGLFAGCLKDNALKDGISVKNCGAEGSIEAATNYAQVGWLAIGGFIGNCNARGLVTESYADANIIVSKYKNSSATDEFDLYVGGFIGTNNISNGSNITKCVAASEIKIYAGEYKLNEDGTEPEVDYQNVKMTKGTTTTSSKTRHFFSYLGGFIGKIQGQIDKIDNCYAIFKADLPFYINAKLDSTTVYTDEFANTEEGKYSVKLENKITDAEILQQVTFKAYYLEDEQEVNVASGATFDPSKELKTRVVNNSEKTLMLDIIKENSTNETYEIEALSTEECDFTLDANTIVRLYMPDENIESYFYVGDVAGSFGDVEAKVTNTSSSIEGGLSEELYNLFKALIEKYVDLAA